MPGSSGRALLLLACLVFTGAAHADGTSLPASLFSESAEDASAPNDFTAREFTLEWKGEAPAGVTVSIGERSLEWYRVSEVLVLPRGLLLVSAKGVRSGRVTSAGFATPLEVRGGAASAEVPIALVSGPANSIEFVLDDDRHATLLVRFAPRPALSRRRVFIDHSCSPQGVRVAEQAWDETAQWVFVGCKLEHLAGATGRTTALELFVYWDGHWDTTEPSLSVDGAATASESGTVWRLRAGAAANRITLRAGKQLLGLGYGIPPVDHAASIGLGLGPYHYSFEAPGTNTHTFAPLATLYGSYRLKTTIRMVFFDASAINQNFYNDAGIYLSTETTRALDRRLIVNLMLGAHVLVFRSGDQTFVRPGGPQGIELIYRDAFRRAHNLSAGAFVYPPIDNRSYYNVWLRWGSSSFFGEVNFIAWREHAGTYDTQSAYNRSIGISFGLPLFRLF